jgi:hypothetical protein
LPEKEPISKLCDEVGIRPGTPLSLEGARRLVAGYLEHYNDAGYVKNENADLG